MDFKKENKIFNKYDKKNKKKTLLKMEFLMNKNDNSLRNLEEYNTSQLFNSTNDTLSLNDILDMIDILIDVVSDFQNMLKDSDFYQFLSYYYSLKSNFDNFESLLKINEKLLYYSMNLLNPINANNFDYIGDLVSFLLINRDEEILLNNKKYLINSIYNTNSYRKLKETLTGIIISKYNSYSNIINNQSKIINSKDIEKNKKYTKNIDKINTLFRRKFLKIL